MGWFSRFGSGNATASQPQPTVQQAQARLQLAQADAQSALSQSNTPYGPTLPCSAPVALPPCDLSAFEVVESRQKFDLEWSLPDFLGRLRDEIVSAFGGAPPPSAAPGAPPSERTYPAKFSYTTPDDPQQRRLRSGAVIEMVALGERESKKTKVELSVRTDFKFCGAKNHHPELQVRHPDGRWERLPQQSQHKLNVYRAARAYDQLPSGLSGFLGYFWVLANAPTVYEIYAVVCGARQPGPPVGSLAGSIRVYPADQYEFTVTLPPIFKIGYERYDGRRGQAGSSSSEFTATGNLPGLQGTVKYSSEAGPEGRSSSGSVTGTSYGLHGSASTSYSIGSKDGQLSDTLSRTVTVAKVQVSSSRKVEWSSGEETSKLTLEPARVETGVKVALKHNGTELDVADWITGVINLVRRFSETLEEIYTSIEEWKPKVGWFFSVDVTLFTGSFGAAWGYKEWSDHRVFRAFEIYAQLELLKADIKLAFGVDCTIKGIGIVAKVEGGIEGCVSVKASFARVSPDETEAKRAAISGEVKGSLGFNATVISEGWFQLEGTVETGIAVEGGLKVESGHVGVEIEKVTWNGIKARGTLHVRLWFDRDAEITLMNPRPLGGPYLFL